MRRIRAWLLLLALPGVSGGAEQVISLGVLVSGEVSEVKVRAGEPVKQGQLLLKLDERLFQARVTEGLAVVRAAEAALRQADDELVRARELYDRTLLSDYELKQAEVARLQARSELEKARSQLLAARTDLRRASLLAPVDGRIVRVLVYPGQMVQNRFRMQPLLELEVQGALGGNTR